MQESLLYRRSSNDIGKGSREFEKRYDSYPRVCQDSDHQKSQLMSALMFPRIQTLHWQYMKHERRSVSWSIPILHLG